MVFIGLIVGITDSLTDSGQTTPANQTSPPSVRPQSVKEYVDQPMVTEQDLGPNPHSVNPKPAPVNAFTIWDSCITGIRTDYSPTLERALKDGYLMLTLLILHLQPVN